MVVLHCLSDGACLLRHCTGLFQGVTFLLMVHLLLYRILVRTTL